jgi:Transposase protein
MSVEASQMLPHVEAQPATIRWFSALGAVQRVRDHVEVFVGGSLIASFEEHDRATRNATVVGLASDPHVHLGQLADAFDISIETLRLLRRQHAAEGIEAVMQRAPGGRSSKVTGPLRRRIEELFASGLSISKVHGRVRRGRKIGRTSIVRARKIWTAKSAAAPVAASPAVEQQSSLKIAPQAPSPPVPVSNTTPAELVPIASAQPESAAFVQHAGTWLMSAMLGSFGLYDRAQVLARDHAVDAQSLRLALDAVVSALAIGESCVEGVRRIETPSAPLLLRCHHAPSASWVRRVLHEFADTGSAVRLHLGMAGHWIREAHAQAEHPVVFYVDNHLRPYTGKHVLRKGWRMQDKRVRPGTTDYYVHDERGRPVLRVDVPSHDSLPEHLFSIADMLRAGLGEPTRILLAFDRAGAYPETMSQLRDRDLEFVTYERRPFPLLPASAFQDTMQFDGETFGLCDARINLGRGRGRVRRIAVRTPDERQINLVACSEQPGERLVAVMFHRWRQENGFKHGVERWGINQLDGRRVAPYPPDTIVPNPARRRLDHALRLACVREGLARCELARLADDDPRRARWARDMEHAIAEQKELLALRPTLPHRAELSKTELAGKLVHHLGLYKTLLDALRIACANAEADLAYTLAPELDNPAEAKKTLANLLVAPGRVRVNSSSIAVALAPAATAVERDAFGVLLDQVNRDRLTLPADPARRPLRFELQSS